MEFKACLKKEFLEAKRGKTFISIFGMCVAFALFAILYLVIMRIASSVIQIDDEEIQILFSNTYGSSMSFFGAFMMTYFFLVLLFIYSNSISKELNAKQWILPINAGIKPKNLIAAKLIFAVVAVAISFITSALVHFILTILICESDGRAVVDMLICYASMLIFLEFITVITISINAISKKRWLPILIILGTFMLISSTFSNIALKEMQPMGSITLNDLTPFFFQNLPLTFAYGFKYPAYVWISASVTTIIIAAILVVFALLTFKIKPEKAIGLENQKRSWFVFKRKNSEKE